MDEAWLGIAEAGCLFRSRAVSPVELLKALLLRIERLDERCHAFIRVMPESALAEAKQAEAEIAAGKMRGALHGIPYALKDIVDVAGVPTTCNSKIRLDSIARQDAAVVRRLREAGAVLVGKATLHEFATGGAMFDLPWPAARNPWNLAFHPGGSSSGCGTAVAAGFVPAAIGTDTGGSVRHPATACGIVGMKPSFGLVSCEGVFPLAPSLDHVGPMTRTVEDNALLLAAMAGREPDHYVAQLRAGLDGLRIGIADHFHTEDAQANPECVRSIEQTCEVLRELGAIVAPVRLARLSEWTECGRVIQQSEQYRIHRKWLETRRLDYSETARAKFSAGANIPAEDLEAALRKRETLRQEFSSIMRRYDALITLSSFELPCHLEDREAVRRTYMRHARMPFNVTGTPAISVPAGFAREGLPLGIQIAGKANDEAMVYRVAWAYSEAAGWIRQHPAL
jgi:aspartyl-tRNA(Asn)/glutamyl-tRNA(Gln) amidotransferase subunit A